MSNACKYDIITLSETWLKNNHHLIEHVQIPGYRLDYRNRDSKWGGSMGVYIKEHIIVPIHWNKKSLRKYFVITRKVTTFLYKKYIDFYLHKTFRLVCTSKLSQFLCHMRLNLENFTL